VSDGLIMLSIFAGICIAVWAAVQDSHGRWDDVKKAAYERELELARRQAAIIREHGYDEWQARREAEDEYKKDLAKANVA
jgi:hypothetical protein